jgi:ATPases with chaperone activity, ATP-binding subunit
VSYVIDFIVHNSPNGYIGFEQGGMLTNAVKKQPFSVILFDEIEKASEKVHQLLLQVMDAGRLTDGKGQLVLFKDVVLIMTSNLGVKELRAVCKTIGFGDRSKVTSDKRFMALDEAINKTFKPEFVNRISATVHYDILYKESYLKIIQLELDKLKENLKLNKTMYSSLDLRFDKSVIKFLYRDGIDENMGARPLKRTIEKEVSTPLAKTLLTIEDPHNYAVKVSVKKGELYIDVKEKVGKDKTSDPPFYLTKEYSTGE